MSFLFIDEFIQPVVPEFFHDVLRLLHFLCPKLPLLPLREHDALKATLGVLILENSPVYVFEERMCFYFLGSLHSKPLKRIP